MHGTGSKESDSTGYDWAADSFNDNGGESSSGWEDSNGDNGPSNDARSSIDPESSREDPASEADAQSEPTTDEGKKKKRHKRELKTSSAASTSTGNEPDVDTVSSDADITTEESTKASTSDTGKTSTSRHSSVATNEWSISEDGLLRGMKTGGATWTEISSALRIRKKECQSRWKVIKGQRPSTPGAEAPAEPEVAEPESTEADATRGTDHLDNQASSAQDDDDDSADTDINEKPKKGKEPAKYIKKKNKGAKNGNVKKKAKVVDNKWHKGTKNTKVAADNKKAKSHATKAQKEVLSGEEASSETSMSTTSGSSSSALTDFGYGDEVRRHEMRYLQDHIYTSLYPPEIHPEPDAHFSTRDCRLLGLIDSKQKRNRWLEMQANFYNVTGRMVPLELIRDKCERAEAAGKGECDGSSGGKRSSIEKWINEVSQEDLQDPEI